MPNPLHHPVYRRLFAAQVIALLGTGLSTVALALLAFDIAGGEAGVVLGTALALKMVAYVGIAPIVGGFAHRLPRRGLLIGLDLARAGLVLCLPFVSEIWQIYSVIFLLNACSAGFTPTFQATIPDVLPAEEDYTRALSLSRLAYDLENLLTPALAALALLYTGYSALFAANSMAFLVSALLVTSVTLPRAGGVVESVGVWKNVSFGVRAYLATPRLRGLLALSMAVSAAGAMVIVNTVVYVQGTLGGSQVQTAAAYVAYGAASMVVALWLPKRLDTRPERGFMLAGGVVSGLALAVGVVMPGYLALLGVWFMLGAGMSLIQTPAGRLLKRSADGAHRPALFAAQFALSHACWLVTYPLAGWLGATFGLTVAFAVLAAVVALSSACAYRLWPDYDPVAIEHEHSETEHEHPHVHDRHHQHGHDHPGLDPSQPHSHPHRHAPVRHSHAFVIDGHHPIWPRS